MAKLNLIQAKARASSVLEVIISMIVILMVFGIAMMIFTNVTRSSLSLKKLRAEALASQTMLLTEKMATQDSRSFDIDEIKIEVTVAPSEQTGINQVTVSVYDLNHQKMAQMQKLVINHHE